MIASLVSLPQASADADPAVSRSEAGYWLTSWRHEEGLPQVTVNAVTQDAQGFLWVGTEEGLARFDGSRFDVYDRSTTPALGSNAIQSLYFDRQGLLWIGTRRGLARFDGARFTSIEENRLGNRGISALLDDDGGNLWIGTEEGLFRLQDGVLSGWSEQDGLAHDSVLALETGGDGELWIGTAGGLSRLKDDVFQTFSVDEGLPHPQIRALHFDRQNRLWIGTADGLAHRIDGRIQTLDRALKNPIVSALLTDRDGALWVGTYGGLNRLEASGEISESSFRLGPTETRVRALWQDREGSLWIGTGILGLINLRRQTVEVLDGQRGLADDLVWSILEDRNGDFWLGTNHGLNRVAKDGAITTFAPEQGLPGEDIRALGLGRQGLWIGTDLGGLGIYQNNAFRIVQEPSPDGSVTALVEDRQGVLWVGTQQGLQRRQGEELRWLTTAEGLSHNWILTLLEDPAGQLWIGTAAGLMKLVDGRPVAVAAHELAGDGIKTLHLDGDGILWIGTADGGLLRLDTRPGREPQPITRYTAADGLPDPSIHHILEDDHDGLWISSNRGVFRISKADLHRFAHGKIDALNAVSFDETDGMGSRECNGLGHPAGWRSNDGRIWFPTLKGAAVFDPKKVPLQNRILSIHIDQIWVNQEPLPKPEARRTFAGSEITIGPGARELEIELRAVSFRNPQRLQIQYRLEGFESDWRESDAMHTAKYTNLKPGFYRFLVAPGPHGSPEAESIVSVDIKLRPYFFQTWPFFVLILLGLVVTIRGLHGLRVRRLLEQDRLRTIEAKNQEMEQFAYNVCHDLKSPMVTVQGFVDLLQDELRDYPSPEVTQDLRRIRAATSQMSGLLDSLLDFSQTGRITLRTESVDPVVLCREALDLVAGQVAERGVEVIVHEPMPRVTADRKQLLRVLQNLLDNAVKFMGDQQSPKIEIAARRDQDEVIFSVRDNGSGVDPEDQRHIFELFQRAGDGVPGSGIGLALVSRLVAAHGGRIWVESSGRGMGSTFSFSLPAPNG